MLTRAIGSLRYRWKKVLLYIAAFSVLFSLCFGSIVLFSSVRDQKRFLQGSLERSVTLRASSYRIRVNESQAGVLSFSLDAADVETFLGDPAVVGWNACLGSAARIENTVLPYQEEREISWENHRSGQTGAVGKDGMAALFVEDSRRSLAFLVCGLELVEGTHFAGEKENVCLVSQLFAERIGLEVGDTVVATNPTEGLGQREPFRVEAKITGIFSCPDSERLKGIGARAEEMLFFPMEMYEQMGGKETGVSYSQLEKMGVMTPVVDLSCHYSGVTHYEDIVTVQCWISRLTPARIEFSYAAFCGDSEKPCNTGKSLHGCVDAKTFRPINLKKRFPGFYAKLESMVEPDA